MSTPSTDHTTARRHLAVVGAATLAAAALASGVGSTQYNAVDAAWAGVNIN